MASNEAILKLLLIGVDKGAAKTLRGVGDEAEKSGSRTTKFKAAAVAGLAAVGAAAVAFGKKSVDAYRETAKEASVLSRVTGMTIQDSSRLKFAAQESGVEYSTLSTSMRLFSKNLVAAGSSQKKMADLTKQLGFSVRDAHGQLLPMSNLLPKVADRFKKMPDGPQKTAMAMKLFGRSGGDMIKVLNKGSSGLAEFAKESDKTGNTLTNVDGYKKTLQAQREFHAATQGLKIQLGAALFPVLTKLATFMAEHVGPAISNVTGFVRQHQAAISKIAPIVGILVAALAGLLGTLKIFRLVMLGVNLVLEANPIGLIIAALVGLGIALVLAYKHSEKFRDIVNGVFHAVTTAVQKTFNWVKSNWPLLLAILTGPFGLAALAIAKNWDKIKAGGRSVLDFVKGMPGKIGGFFGGVFTGLAHGLESAINAVLHLPLKIPRINTHIPGVGTVGGQTLIPALAKGGIVTRPTVALIGEAGPEAVVPLPRLSGMGGGGGNTYISVNGAMDPKAVAAQIETMLANLKRTSRGGGRLAFQ